MKNRKSTLPVALAILLCSPSLMARQVVKKPTTTAAPIKIEPLRVLAGELRENIVTGVVKQGWTATAFSLTLTKAEIANGRLQLAGEFTLQGGLAQTTDRVTATLGGVMSNAANPWPNARQERRIEAKKSIEEQTPGKQQQGREAKTPRTSGQLGQPAQSTQDTARKTPPAPDDKTEQTQSLFAESEMSNSCGVMFLKLTLPRRLRARIGAVGPLQLGVVLNPFDNERGEQIVEQICRLLQNSRGDKSVSLDQLNRLFVSSKQTIVTRPYHVSKARL